MNADLRFRMIVAATLVLLTGMAMFLAVFWVLSFTRIWPGIANFIAMLLGATGSGMVNFYARKFGLIDGPLDLGVRVGFRAPFWVCLAISVTIAVGTLYFLTDDQTRSQYPWSSIFWIVVVNNPLADLIYWICLPCFDAITARSGRFRFIMSREG